jgi:DNA-binding CsgD family transcriptional regulator
MNDQRTRSTFTPTRPLTPTQWQVVALLWHEELNYEGVAARLGIAVRTVKMHVENAAFWLPGYGPSSWKVLRHAESLLEMGHADTDPTDEQAA